MLLSAGVLAECAPDDIQKRALARYTFLYADAGLQWARRWRNQLARNAETAGLARSARSAVRDLAAALDAAGDVRDYLAAKRKPLAGMRADDIDATTRLWSAVNAINVRAIAEAAVRAHAALDQASPGRPSIHGQLYLDSALRARVSAALPARDRTHWHLAADSAADLRPFTLPAAQGGEIGRLIAQINDVAGHLDVLLRIAPVLHGTLPYDWLVRSALVVELNALLDLTLGPPPSHARTVLYSLLDRCRRGRGEAIAADLERLRMSIGHDDWNYVRWMRNTIGAHVDDRLTVFQIHEHLAHLDYLGIIRLAEHVLDFLDAVGATQLDVQLLLIGERIIKSWPVDASIGAFPRPHTGAIPGALADLFRRIDSSYMVGTASNRGSALIAGIWARRRPKPRKKVTVPPRWNDYLDPLPPRLPAEFGRG
jgi:hypothetical protein